MPPALRIERPMEHTIELVIPGSMMDKMNELQSLLNAGGYYDMIDKALAVVRKQRRATGKMDAKPFVRSPLAKVVRRG